MYRYLNLENAWPGLTLEGLANAGGALRLKTVPAGPGAVAPPLTGLALDAAGLRGPAGIGVDSEGNVFIPDPDANRILMWRRCDHAVCALHCLQAGSLPGQLIKPRGVLVGPRSALYVADSGNHRVQVFDLATLQLRAIWSQPDPLAAPQAGSAAGRLDDPWEVAADAAGHIYVLDHGNRRIQQFDADGQVITAFWEKLRTQPFVPGEPAALAVALIDGEERLLVADRKPSRVLVYLADGTYDAAASQRWITLADGVPGGLVLVRPECGGNQAMPALAFDENGTFTGALEVPRQVQAGLAVDGKNRLLIGGSDGNVSNGLLPGQLFAEAGYFVAGPYAVGDSPTRWQRLRASVDDAALLAGSHIQFFTYTSTDGAGPPLPPAGPLPDAPATGPGIWRPAPLDAVDFLILHEPAATLWVGAVLQGDRHGTPVVHQVRLDFECESWLRYLPAIYSREVSADAFLERTLALLESQLGNVEDELDDLALLLDPWAAPDHPPTGWLDWLSGWLAFGLEEEWAPEKRRAALAGAFDLLGRRGTVEGLRQMIALFAGVDAVIEEPGRDTSVWSLGENSILGFDTMLAAAEADGAILGRSATVNASHLSSATDFGAPLFNDLAHRFRVLIRAGQLSATDGAAAVRRVLDREKPAHTSYELCVVEPRMRVGEQARLGVDAIVAGPASPMVLDGQMQLGSDTLLPPSKRGTGEILGAGTRVGAGRGLI